MFTQNEKEWILEAINHLKRRKARPDFPRISLRMKRKHQLTIAQTRQLLDSLVESGIVVKAVYKNNTSYRDVSKWKKGKLGGQILNSSRMLQRFVKAITAKQPSDSNDGKCTGVSAKEIEEWLSHENEDKCFLSGAALRDAIENEVSNGYLMKVEIHNESFYSVNTEKVKDISFRVDSLNSLEKSHESSFENSFNVSDLSLYEDELGVTANDLCYLKMAIYETEEKRGDGSTLMNIENWMMNQSSDVSPLKKNRTLLLEFLKSQVKAGFIMETTRENVTLYSVNEAVSHDDKSARFTNNNNFNNLDHHGHGKAFIDESDNQDIKFSNSFMISSKQSGKATAVSLRPPSKRKRIQKSHGPDFETELPTKSKSKFVADPREYNFPTPVDSPVSEKSETSMDQNFKFDQKKKRGRPKKSLNPGNDQNNLVEDDMETLEDDNSKYGGPSEQSSICQEDNEDCVSEEPLPDASSWSAQQVADYFYEQGYEEESKQMLDNDLDGVALGLLRRSDIVGPPAGGILKIKKLGVALKLFRDVRNLLYQGNAENYVDPYEERPFCRS